MSKHVTISPNEAADRLAIRELVEAYAAPIVAMPKARCLSLLLRILGVHVHDEVLSADFELLRS